MYILSSTIIITALFQGGSVPNEEKIYAKVKCFSVPHLTGHNK